MESSPISKLQMHDYGYYMLDFESDLGFDVILPISTKDI
jgi:hypothetical protein